MLVVISVFLISSVLLLYIGFSRLLLVVCRCGYCVCSSSVVVRFFLSGVLWVVLC